MPRFLKRWRNRRKEENEILEIGKEKEKEVKITRGFLSWNKVKERRKKRKKNGFFSKDRVKERREFRIKVSGNRKWIMIGLAVVAVCGTVIYFSVTYGGGLSEIMKLLGTFK